MSRIAYVNGRYLPHRRAAIHVEDRGFQFADGVYEVIGVQGGRLVDERPHLDRLARSLAALSMKAPMGERALAHVMRETVRRNRVRSGILYLQITRGVAARDHAFPADAEPSLVMMARAVSGPAPGLVEKGCAVITVPDIRWKRCDIKTVSLLANVLAKQQAKEAGAFEALQVDEDGLITEGATANAWIISQDGVLVTRPADHAILDGVTRRAVIALAARAELAFEERAFSVDEAKAAAEAFLTGTTAYVMPITRIDGSPIGSGVPGPFSLRLLADYTAHAAAGGDRR
ncbi:MAG: D-amino-acid transaminase [Alphaproteobacteria bacterium]|nr:MAG: D-amino-acid transaminase [Alphaproteobacteria bacterium]